MTGLVYVVASGLRAVHGVSVSDYVHKTKPTLVRMPGGVSVFKSTVYNDGFIRMKELVILLLADFVRGHRSTVIDFGGRERRGGLIWSSESARLFQGISSKIYPLIKNQIVSRSLTVVLVIPEPPIYLPIGKPSGLSEFIAQPNIWSLIFDELNARQMSLITGNCRINEYQSGSDFRPTKYLAILGYHSHVGRFCNPLESSR